MTDSSQKSIHDRLVSAAREHAASTGTSFRASLDHVAAVNGYRDWSEHEDMSKDRRLLRRFDYVSIYVFGPSIPIPRTGGKDTRGFVERIAMTIALPIAKALGSVDRMLHASGVMAMTALVLTIIAIGFAFGAMMGSIGTIQMGIASVIACLNAIIAWTWTTRSTAARMHPRHRGVPFLLSMPIYWSFWAVPLSAMSVILPMIGPQNEASDPNLTRVGIVMMAASSLWFVSMVLILHAGRSSDHG
jgi:hypothetical protein